MSTQVQYRRGTAAENNVFVGAYAEITVDTTNWILRVQDGATAGGFATVGLATTQTLSNKTLAAPTLTGVTTAATVNATLISSSGNVTGQNLLTGGVISATGSITSAGLVQGATLSATGNVNSAGIVTGVVTTSGLINSNANGVGNIGSSTTYFNTVFAKATSAQYADLAEKYTADAEYEVGTVLVIGGDAEVTQSTEYNQTSVAGTVSENPATIMNAGLRGTTATVALLGRVPCKVVGKINKGDLLVTSNLPGVATPAINNDARLGSVVGKALESYNSLEVGVIEIMVGRV